MNIPISGLLKLIKLSDTQLIILRSVAEKRAKNATRLVNLISLEQTIPKSTLWFNLRRLSDTGLLNFNSGIKLTKLGKQILGLKGNFVLGIIGGVGPETSAKFHLDLIRRSRKELRVQPRIIMSIVPISEKLEERAIRGKIHLVKPLLEECIEQLNSAGVSTIVLGSNTCHLLIDELRKISQAPVLSIVDETIKEIKKQGFSKIGLLATKTSIDLNLFQPRLKEESIDFLIPFKREQKELSGALGNMLKRGNPTVEEKAVMHRLIENMANRGAEAVILACTDLQFLAPKKASIPIVDTLEVLTNASFELIKSRSSSMVEHSVVARKVAGSTPACGTSKIWGGDGRSI